MTTQALGIIFMLSTVGGVSYVLGLIHGRTQAMRETIARRRFNQERPL